MSSKKEINGELKTANPFKASLFAFALTLGFMSLEFLLYLIPILGLLLLFANILALFIVPLIVFIFPQLRKYYTGKCPACGRKMWYLKLMSGINCHSCRSRIFFVEGKGFEVT
jgi:DNA-directed RNA polymerase subunit RPC12/RpoP